MTQTAVVLDTCIVSTNVLTLEQIARANSDIDAERTYFLPKPVIAELETWLIASERDILPQSQRIEKRRIGLEAKAMCPTYLDPRNFLSIVTEEKPRTKNGGDNYAARIFQDALLSPTTIDIRHANGEVHKYFDKFVERCIEGNYQEVLEILGLEISVEKNKRIHSVSVYKKTAKDKKRREITIKKQEHLDRHFLSYEKQIETANKELEKHKQEYVNHYNAKRILGYFRLRSQFILEGKTDPEIAKLAKLTAKYLLSEIYEKHYSSGQIRRKDLDDIMSLARVKTENKLDEFQFQGGRRRSVSQVLHNMLDRLYHCAQNCIRYKKGRVPKEKGEVDANIVSLAYHLPETYSGLSTIQVMSRDRDIQTITALCDTLLHPMGFKLRYKIIPFKNT